MRAWHGSDCCGDGGQLPFWLSGIGGWVLIARDIFYYRQEVRIHSSSNGERSGAVGTAWLSPKRISIFKMGLVQPLPDVFHFRGCCGRAAAMGRHCFPEERKNM